MYLQYPIKPLTTSHLRGGLLRDCMRAFSALWFSLIMHLSRGRERAGAGAAPASWQAKTNLWDCAVYVLVFTPLNVLGSNSEHWSYIS